MDMEEVEIDLGQFTRDELLSFLHGMHEKDMSLNEYVTYILTEMTKDKE